MPIKTMFGTLAGKIEDPGIVAPNTAAMTTPLRPLEPFGKPKWSQTDSTMGSRSKTLPMPAGIKKASRIPMTTIPVIRRT